jgi:hypothetical protein
MTLGDRRDKEKVRAAVGARGLVSVMNGTKWRALVARVKTLPFPPPFQVKSVLAATPVPASFDSDVWYLGDWNEGLSPYYDVEWIRVRARIVKTHGKYAKAEIEDIEDQFLAILMDIGVPHRKSGDCVEIFGYTESTAGLHR